MEDKKITIGELRRLLFQVENQDLTIKDFRQILFAVKDQDAELNFDSLKKMFHI